VGFYIFTAKDETTPYWHHQIHTIRTGRTDVPYAFTVRVPRPDDIAPTDPWLVNIMRASVDSANSRSFLQFVTKYRKLPDINYPYTALLGVRVEDASQLNGTIPLVSARVKGMKLVLPSNYDPVTRTRAGAWTGSFAMLGGSPRLQYSNNLSWVIYNLLSDWHTMTIDGITYPRFLNIDRNWIAKFDFEAFAIYCDELVSSQTGTTPAGYPILTSEPRYVCNGQFLERMDAGAFIDTLLSIGNAKLIELDGLVSIIWDRKYPMGEIESSPILTNDNVENGLFEYSNSHISENFTQVNMTIQDITNKNRTLTVSVEATELERYWSAIGLSKPANYYTNLYGFNSTDVMVQGVTSISAARRKARGLLWDGLENNDFVAFKTLVQGATFHIGQVIRVNDSGITRVVSSGRVEQIAQNNNLINLTLDKAVTLLGASSYSISIYDSAGVVQKLLLQETSGTHTVVSIRKTVIGVPLTLAESSIWVINSPTLKTYKVVSLMQQDKAWEVAAVLYRPEKFDFVEGAWEGGAASSLLPTSYQMNPTQKLMPSPANFTLTWNPSGSHVYAHWDGVTPQPAPPEYYIAITIEPSSGTVDGQYITTGTIIRYTIQTFEWYAVVPITVPHPVIVTVSVTVVAAGALPSAPITRKLIIT
jgi:predicted phage tail protein